MKAKRIMALLLTVAIICVIVGCEKECSNVEISKSETKPEFKVVLVDKEVREYIKSARENKGDLDKLYREIVCEPIWNEIGRDEDSFGWTIYYFNTIRKLDLLENEMDILVNEDVVSMVEDALEECNKFLPAANATVYIFPYDPTDRTFTYNARGVGSFTTFGRGREIFLFLNPTHGGWKERIKYAVAHEYHHSTWMYKNYREYEVTLLDYLILEGKADSFANIVYPDVEVSHTSTSISLSREKELWEKIKPNLDSTDAKYNQRVIFGDYEEFPYWTGYTIGYNIVQEYIKNNPNVSIEEWTNIEAKDILENSRYEKRFENLH